MSLSKLQGIKTIAFDADDTLWRTEDFFLAAQDSFINLLSPYHDDTYIKEHLSRIQLNNLHTFGYGIKGFTLSMIETSIELTEGRISGREIHEIIRLAKQMVSEPISLLPNVESTLLKLQGNYQLMIITKGDLLDQESKVARSGLADYFHHIEVVSHKTPDAYLNILERYQFKKDEFLMVGNSLKSDVLPVLDIGSNAIHIPYEFTWTHEMVDPEVLKAYPSIHTIKSLDELFKSN